MMGFFQTVEQFCLLETLRHCLPPSVRDTLDELPKSLDDTYERILKEMKKPNRAHPHRCLVVAILPLRVEELADSEVFAVNFGDEERISKLNSNWRWEVQEQALLSSCSSLIAIVEPGESTIVQLAFFGQRVPDLDSTRNIEWRCLVILLVSALHCL